MKRKLFVLCLIFACSACGKQREFRAAKKMERLGRYPTAISQYENFAQKYPKDSHAPESLFRIGRIYETVFKDYTKARAYYEKVARSSREGAWPAEAENAFMDCPDYFPLIPGAKKVIGDSQSSGENMRIEEIVEPSKKNQRRFTVKQKIYAGDSQVSSSQEQYEKKGLELRQYKPENSAYAVILRYPPTKNLSWETLQNNQRIIFTIEETEAAVEVKAGVFISCLKVRKQPQGYKTPWKYEYYAPGTGLVLTSVATEKSETRIAELLSCTGLKKGPDTLKPGIFQSLKNFLTRY